MRPGFIRLCGSSACLMARIRPSATGDLCWASFVALEAADAVFGRDGALVALHLGINQLVHGLFLLLQKGFGVAALGGLHVVVQVAVAQMAVGHHAGTRKGGCYGGIGLAHKVGDARYGNGNIVLDVQPFLRLCQRNAFADMPKRTRLRQAFCHHGIRAHSRFAAPLPSNCSSCWRACAWECESDISSTTQ